MKNWLPAVIIEEFFRHVQVRFAVVVVAADALQISFCDERGHLIARVRLRNTDKIGKLADGRAIQQIDHLGGERLGRAQTARFFAQLAEEIAVVRKAQIAI